jgi:uncharacterized protein YjbI with pentapeptide repeats
MATLRRRIPNRLLWALAGVTAVALVLFILWWGPWLFTRHPSHGLTSEEELAAKNDVRTTLVQAVAGIAVAAGAIVTYRTFHHSRLEQERTYKLNQSQQVTETYTKAVEQLGHGEAPVRLGALYSLAGLAQDNPSRRQTVVDVICAYLRMPYTPPRRDKPATGWAATANLAAPPAPHEGEPRRDAAQELQVRQTAQRLLADHLRQPTNIQAQDAQGLDASPKAPFWRGIRLDLSGASLVDLSLTDASVIRADFCRATFFGDASFVGAAVSGDASFDGATFSGDAAFNEATFSGHASFDGATFSGDAAFNEATFSRHASFDGTTFSSDASFCGAAFPDRASFDRAAFSGHAWFDGAAFSGRASFDGTAFSGDAWFDGAAFSGKAWFVGAAFCGHASFGGAAFSGDAWFGEAAFSGMAWFGGAAFSSHASFDEATFSAKAWFERVTHSGHASFDRARVLRLDDPEVVGGGGRVWPHEWTVRPDEDDPTRGTLVRS